MVGILSRFDWKFTRFLSAYAKDTPSATFTIILFFIVAFILGELLNSFRDFLEGLWDEISPVDWDYLVESPPGELENFRSHFFTYYVLNANLVLAFGLFLLMLRFRLASWPPSPLPLFASLGLCLFLFDAISLRREIVRITNQRMTLLRARMETSEEQTNSNQE
jgi:hypothetical protein